MSSCCDKCGCSPCYCPMDKVMNNTSVEIVPRVPTIEMFNALTAELDFGYGYNAMLNVSPPYPPLTDEEVREMFAHWQSDALEPEKDFADYHSFHAAIRAYEARLGVK